MSCVVKAQREIKIGSCSLHFIFLEKVIEISTFFPLFISMAAFFCLHLDVVPAFQIRNYRLRNIWVNKRSTRRVTERKWNRVFMKQEEEEEEDSDHYIVRQKLGVISPALSKASFAELNAKTSMKTSSAFFLSSVLVLLIVIILFVVLWWHRKCTLMSIWRSTKSSTTGSSGLPEHLNSNLRTISYFDYHTLKRATTNFHPRNQLGKGGFGPVYQGRLDDGRRIAVKQLCLGGKSGQGESEFLAEVGMLTSIQHKNLVRLIGCCSEGSHRLVVYEFMKNRSLDYLIYENSEIFLTWKTRFQIILGIARGLQYLHEDSNIRIVHRDIKASNILLNEKLQPKISDFGLARLFPEDELYLSGQFAGTLGYTAPEYAIKGELSEKADIYSFGVLTLEIICSRKNTDLTLPAKMQYLPEYAWKLYESSVVLDLVDPRLKADGIEKDDVDDVLNVCQVALLCLQPYPSLRPSMSEVVSMLTSKNKQIASPMKPAFFDRKRGIDLDINSPFSCEVVSEFFPSPASDSVTLPPKLVRKFP